MNESKIVTDVTKIVRSKVTPDNWFFHDSIVRDRALELGKLLGGDLEILELSAILHDVGRSLYGREEHEKTGAKHAVEVLAELGYPQDRTRLVEDCILKHCATEENKPENLEERILANADAMSHFDQAFYLVYLRAKKIGLKAAVEKTIRGLDDRWNGKLDLPEARTLIEEKREAVMETLNSLI